MKENSYDNPRFFTQYSRMDRSRKGLAGAGEWPTLKTMLPALAGKRVLDLGCGYGWHCRYCLLYTSCCGQYNPASGQFPAAGPHTEMCIRDRCLPPGPARYADDHRTRRPVMEPLA